MKFKILHKILMPLLLILFAASIASGYLFFEFKTVITSATATEELSEKQKELLTLRMEITSLMMAANDVIITADQKYKTEYNRSFSSIDEWYSKLESSKFNSEEQKIISDIRFDILKMDSISALIFEEAPKGVPHRIAKLMEELDYQHAENALSSLNKIFLSLSNEFTERKVVLKNLREKIFHVIYAFASFMILLIFFVGYRSVKNFSNPINSLMRNTEKISKGDYSNISDINSNDEIGELSSAMKKMANEIQADQTALERGKIFLENVIETIPSGLIVVKKEKRKMTLPELIGTGKVILVNDNFCKMFDAKKSEVLSKTISETLTNINFPEYCKDLVIGNHLKNSFQCDCFVPTKGRLVLDLNLVGFEIGEEHMLIVMHNITELKRAEEALQREKEKAQLYLDVAGVILLIINSDQTVGLINKRGREILGYEEEEIIGKNWFDNFVHESQRSEIKNIFEILISERNSNVEYFENEIITKNGARLIAWHNSLIKNESGKITATLSSGEDITEKRKQELLLQKYNDELKDLNSQKDKLFSIISHDLRSPFTGLLGYSEILVEETQNIQPTDLHKYSLALKETAQNMFTHLNNLLEWSRLQRNKIEIVIEKINLNAAASETINLLLRNAEKKNISIEVNIDPSIFVQADKNMLRSIFQNLLSNAIKFTHTGGKIEIIAKRLSDSAEVTVSDSGIGMDEEELQKIFRIDSKSRNGTADEKGTGLGLSITKEMIEKQFGKIEVFSKVGEGTKFVFSIPT